MSDVSESFVASISHALNSHHVPCILWGQYLLQVFGVPTIVSSIDFVVPDDLLFAAAEAISQCKDTTACPDAEECHASSSQRRTPPPAYHAHVASSEITVALYLQSETLWFLPQLSRSMPVNKDPIMSAHFILASDRTALPPQRPGRGRGALKSNADPVVVPKSHILLEAYLRLYARDVGKRIGAFAMAMLAYVQLYIDDDGFLDHRQLPDPLKLSYEELRYGDKPVRQWTRELKQALGLPEDSDSED